MHANVHKTSADGATSRATVKIEPAGATLQLQHAQFAQLHGTLGWTIKALSGAVWITQDGDIRDVVLQAGESFVVDRKGRALLSSFDDAQVCISLGGCNRPAQRPAGTAAPAIAAGARPAFA